MPTLILHASYSQARYDLKPNFDQTMKTGKGTGYAINNALSQRLSPGDDVIVICKAEEKQAAGKIERLIPTVKTGGGVQRYDIIMLDLEEVPYTCGNVALNRNGVAIL